MTTVAVLSDTHRNYAAIEAIKPVLDECDLIIHLGDHFDDMEPFHALYADKLYRVCGNCDYGRIREYVLPVEGRTLLVTHGDLYGVKQGTERLKAKAREEGCDVVLYGHTHTATVEERDGILLVNPGCMTAFAPEKTFCYLVIHEKMCTAVLRNLSI